MITFLVPLRYILRMQHTILRVKYIISTQFYPETISSPTGKLVLLNECKTAYHFWNLIQVKGSLKERGLNRAFAVLEFSIHLSVDLSPKFLFVGLTIAASICIFIDLRPAKKPGR